MITTDQIMSWDPCFAYPEKRVRQIIGDGKTPLELLDLKLDSLTDNLWLVLRPEVLGDDLIPAVCDIVDRIVPSYLRDDQIRASIEVTQRLAARQATRKKLNYANAALVTGEAATRAATWAVARATKAAKNSGNSANAARSALGASRNAAWAVPEIGWIIEEVEHAAQIEIVRHYLQTKKGE